MHAAPQLARLAPNREQLFCMCHANQAAMCAQAAEQPRLRAHAAARGP